MHIAGIIAEYNPFHNGHLYQITETKKTLNCDALIVVMSGNFSQRGSACVCDKFTRAKMALLNGADLVLELPIPFATASAEFFAHYSVSTLHETHLVDTLSFGSESGSLAQLDQVAELLYCPPYALDEKLKCALKSGLSFPAAREKAILESLSHFEASQELSQLVKSPNNILAIEYLKAIKKIRSDIHPFTIQRKNADYHEETLSGHIASATAIRKALSNNDSLYRNYVPSSVAELLQQHPIPKMNDLCSFIHFKFMFSQLQDLYAYWDIPESLINALYKQCDFNTSYDELVNATTSKTYTRATIKRSLLRLILGITSEKMALITQNHKVPYIRVLGCRKECTFLLKALKNQSTVPVITNFSKAYNTLDATCHALMELEIAASQLYDYLTGSSIHVRKDFTTPFLLV